MLNKVQKYVVLAITFGNILEWYDLYLYIYWAPKIASLFFGDNGDFVNLYSAIAFFCIGFFFRPLGGIFFGYIGDRYGRKNAFISSILLMTIPTFLIGLMPTYEQIGSLATLFLFIARILQTFPSGGELPGAFCYLYENANHHNKIFMTSFAGVGNQIGIALSAMECFLLEMFLPHDIHMNYGWRISFIVGGFIGLLGFILRYKLHETKLFHEMVLHHKLWKEGVISAIKDFWRPIFSGIGYGVIQTVAFHVFSIVFPVYFFNYLGINKSVNLLISIVLLLSTGFLLPFFGYVSEKMEFKRLLIVSCLGIVLLLYPISLLESYKSNLLVFILVISLFLIFLAYLTAIWPYLLTSLFPTEVRYTCVGISFNCADGILGGLSSFITFYLVGYLNNPSIFVWMILLASIVSFVSFLGLKRRVI